MEKPRERVHVLEKTVAGLSGTEPSFCGVFCSPIIKE